MAEGHCGLPRAELIEASVRVLEVETGLVEQGIGEEVAEGTLVEDTIGGQPAVFAYRDELMGHQRREGLRSEPRHRCPAPPGREPPAR